MDNQHKKIKGYRDLSQQEINQMNTAKDLERAVMALVNDLNQGEADPRWLAISKTTLQTGFMQLIRSVAKPDEL